MPQQQDQAASQQAQQSLQVVSQFLRTISLPIDGEPGQVSHSLLSHHIGTISDYVGSHEHAVKMSEEVEKIRCEYREQIAGLHKQLEEANAEIQRVGKELMDQRLKNEPK